MTLEGIIKGDSFPTAETTLNQRLKLVLKLAEAVFFLHAAGFIHKNITSSSIIALQRPGSTPSSSLGDSYLMGFGLIRGVDSRTSNEGAVREAEERVGLIWVFDIFQHPDRLCGGISPRYTKTYDVYSLGVVLLEIGWWEPLSEAVQALNEDDPSSWAKEILGTVPALGPRTGETSALLLGVLASMDTRLSQKALSLNTWWIRLMR
jgi:serine/threonine protein kinase